MRGLTTTIDCNPGAAAPQVEFAPLRSASPPRLPSISREVHKLYRRITGDRAGGRGLRNDGYHFGRPYEGARLDREDRWRPTHGSGDAALDGAWDLLTTRARDLVRDEPYASAAVGRIVENVIGDEGIQAEAAIRIDGESIPENRLIDEAFLQWAEYEADAEGELSWWEMQALAMGEVPEAGETILYQVASPERNRLIPLCYQVLEAEQLDHSKNAPRGVDQNLIKRGVEFDARNRRVAYWIFSDHPHDLQPMQTWASVRVPAERIIHYYKKSRPSLTRGVTWFAPVLRFMRHFNGYTTSEMESAHAGSKFAVAVMRANGAGSGLSLGSDDDLDDEAYGEDGCESLQRLYGAIIADLESGDKIEQVQSNRPNPQAEPWIQLMLNAMANGIGMTYLGLTGDVRKASYSSSRFSQLIDKKFWRPLQKGFGRGVVLPVRYQVIRQLAALRRISGLEPQQVAANPRLWLATRLRGPGWEEIDKPKEVGGTVEKIRAGLGTFQAECAGTGSGWRENIDSLAEAAAYAQEKLEPFGIKLTWMEPSPAAVQAAAISPAPEVQPSEDD